LSELASTHAIRNRLLISMSATVLLGILLTMVVFVVGAQTIRTLADRTATSRAIEDVTHTLETSLFTQETFVFDYALSGRAEAREEFDAGRSNRRRLSRTSERSPKETSRFSRLPIAPTSSETSGERNGPSPSCVRSAGPAEHRASTP